MREGVCIKVECPGKVVRQLKVHAIVKRAEGNLVGVFTVDSIREPLILITGYYDTVRHGILKRFAVVIPKQGVIRREICGGVIYYHLKSGKKVVIYYGDAEEPALAKIKEMDDSDFEEIRKLQEVEKLIP